MIVGRSHTRRYGRIVGTDDGSAVVRTRIYAKSAHLVAADHDRQDVADAVTSVVASLAASVRPAQPVEP